MTVVYFHDLPVYRLSAERYQDVIERMVERHVDQAKGGAFPPSLESLKSLRLKMEEHHYDKYGPWCFNEVVGYLKLHFLGSQVRGEYIGQRRAKYYLSRTKVFIYQTHKLAPEDEIPSGATNQQVLEVILDYVDSCRRELPRRYFDDRWLREVGPFIDWNALRRLKATQS